LTITNLDIHILTPINNYNRYVFLVTHDHNLTGAPYYLYNLAIYLMKMNINVLIVAQEYNKLVYDRLISKYKINIVYHYNYLPYIELLLDKYKPKFIYVNSIPEYYEYYVNLQKHYNILFHSHEPFELFMYKNFVNKLDNFYVVSDKIKNIYNQKGYKKVKVGKIFIDQKEIDNVILKSCDLVYPIKNKFRNLDSKKIIMGMCGTFEYRKGNDIFINCAKKNKHKEFIWIGGKCNITDYPENFFHIEHTDNPYKYFKLLDIFFLSSRQEATPFVIEEVKILKKPIIYNEKDIDKYEKSAIHVYSDIVNTKPSAEIITLITNSLANKNIT